VQSALRSLYRYWAALLFVAIWVQIASAAYGAFYAHHTADKHGPLSEKTIDSGFDFHSGLGTAIAAGAIILFLIALGARFTRRRIFFSLGLAVLTVLQIPLAEAGKAAPWAGGFHGAVALMIFGMTGGTTFAAWGRRPPAPM
jgi:hypothetical protein